MSRWHEPAPGEREAGQRSWPVVRSAFAAREAVPRRRARWPIVAVMAGAAVVAASLSPPGLAVLGSIRDAVRGEPNAKPALFSLPTQARLLVNSSRGAWVVQRDGSKRLLKDYRDASWSPNGVYLAAVNGHELRALEPDGDVHWTLARPGRVAAPRWSDASPPCCRIAYLAGESLRVVNGDGTGDRLLADAVRPTAPAWRPRTHQVAYVNAAGNIEVADADSRAHLWKVDTSAPFRLAWSDDGRRLLALSVSSLAIYRGDGRLLATAPVGGVATTAAFVPRSHAVSLVRRLRGSSYVELTSETDLRARRRLFSAAGNFGEAAWSPGGRWLLIAWDAADQWLFVRSAVVRKAVSGITESFGEEPSVAGWCCR